MVITLKEYLGRLERQTARKREQGQEVKDVPTMVEIADRIGIHPVTLSNIANNNIKQLNLATAGKIMRALRDINPDTKLTDWLAYEEDEPAISQ